MQARLTEAVRRGGTICVPVGAIAQAWRSSRQVRLARLLRSRDIDVAVMTPNVARSVGLLCARSGHDEVIDVHVALCARERRDAVITRATRTTFHAWTQRCPSSGPDSRRPTRRSSSAPPFPAAAALEVVRERTVAGGAIVFDHFTGTGRFRYTLGERIAGRALLDDPRWFHLHGTGVFYRQETGR